MDTFVDVTADWMELLMATIAVALLELKKVLELAAPEVDLSARMTVD